MRLVIPVTEQQQGIALRALLRQCRISTELSRAVKYRGSGYYLDGAPARTNAVLQAGQLVSFTLPPEQDTSVVPQPIPVKVARQDPFALVLDKPAGLAVHPTLNYPDGTLANGVVLLQRQQGSLAPFRPVNRLDKNTSGLVLAARNAYAACWLGETAQKQYWALCRGRLPLGPGVIDAPIARRGDSIIGRCVDPAGKPSRTEYVVAAACDAVSLVLCRPVTGRTHQIRVHFSHLGHPLLGDTLYGGGTEDMARHALHCGLMAYSVPAYRETGEPGELELTAPLCWQRVLCRSPLPEDMRQVCEKYNIDTTDFEALALREFEKFA